MSRTLETDGRNLVVRVYPELQDAISSYARKTAWRRKGKGEDVSAGELKGHSHAIGRVLCWLMTLSDSDRARIQEEGGRLLDRLHELPADYEGPLPFEGRPDSVFRGNAIDRGVGPGEDVAARPRTAGTREVDKPRPSKRTG